MMIIFKIKFRKFLSLSLALIACMAGAQMRNDTISFNYFNPPGDSSIIFAPGKISAKNRSIQKIAFSPDGKNCLLGIRETNIPTILIAKNINGCWSEFVKADFLNDNQREKEPFYSPDGKKIFFVRYAAIWVVTINDSGWSKPEILDSPVNVMAEQYHPTLTMDGTLYFCSNRGGSYNIYRSKPENGKYKRIEKLDSLINSHVPGSDGAYDPYIAPDESYIIFSSNNKQGYGNTDQYISYNINGHWTKPENLGIKINTDKEEYGSYITPDGKYYFFARFNTSLADLYWINTSFIRKPQNIHK
jgi:hypothetical protein